MKEWVAREYVLAGRTPGGINRLRATGHSWTFRHKWMAVQQKNWREGWMLWWHNRRVYVRVRKVTA